MTVQPHLTVDQLFQAARNQEDCKVARRIRVIAIAQQSHTCAEIARLSGESQRSIGRWLRHYNAHGLEGLTDQPRSGRPPKLAREQEQPFKDRVEAGPTEQDVVSVMHGKDYQRILQEEFGKTYCLNGVYELLHRLGYSWLMPRPEHEHADRQAQADFKKTSVNSLKTSRPRTQTRR